MVNINCPVCKSQTRKYSRIFTLEKDRTDFQIVRCADCLHVYTSFSSPVELQAYYDEKDYRVKDTRGSIFHKIQEKEYRQVLGQIRELTAAVQPSLLDFGAGKGLFMNFAQLGGFEVKGVETSVPRARYAAETFGLKVSSENFERGTIFHTRFDVITLFHVEEHLPEPVELLHNLIADNMKMNGVVVIEVPNFDSWQSRWSGKHWLHLDVPRHLNHFTPQRLEGLIEDLGFKVIREEYFSLHLGIVGMIQCIWSRFGYKDFLIGRLKEKKSFLLLLTIAITLPAAFLIESIAALRKKGGIIRYSLRRDVI